MLVKGPHGVDPHHQRSVLSTEESISGKAIVRFSESINSKSSCMESMQEKTVKAILQKHIRSSNCQNKFTQCVTLQAVNYEGTVMITLQVKTAKVSVWILFYAFRVLC